MQERQVRETRGATEGTTEDVAAERSSGTTTLADLAADGGMMGETASELAYAEAEGEDKNVTELKTKVGALVDKRFGGDYKKASTTTTRTRTAVSTSRRSSSS
jgi:hypothetical protein